MAVGTGRRMAITRAKALIKPMTIPALTCGKYGAGYETLYPELVHRRLKSWGLTPSPTGPTENLRAAPHSLHGHDQFRLKGGGRFKRLLGKFYDVFDPDFASACHQAVAREKAKSIGIPGALASTCIMNWRGGRHLPGAGSPGFATRQAAKLAFLDILKAKYKDIGKLNEAWGGNYESWKHCASLPRARTSKRPDRFAGVLQPFCRDLFSHNPR